MVFFFLLGKRDGALWSVGFFLVDGMGPGAMRLSFVLCGLECRCLAMVFGV
jgi:uncharacterized membrane protein